MLRMSVYVVVMTAMAFSYSFMGAVPAADAVVQTGTVTGRVVAGGSPVGQGDVGVDIGTGNGPGIGSTGTENNGTFTLENIPAGTYTVTTHINADNLSSYMNSTVENVTVTAGNTTAMGDVALTAATKTISGTVTRKSTGAPVVGAQINAFRMDGSPLNKSATTNSAGAYSLKVTGGQWGLSVSGGYDNEGQQVEVDWIYSGMPKDQNFANDNSVEASTANFQVVTANSRVTGKVLYPDGTAANNLGVDLFSSNGGNMHGQTSSTGVFSIRTTAGTFELNAWFPPDQQQYNFPNQKVSVSANQTVNVGTITLAVKSSRIKGRVITSTGQPLGNVRVNAFSMGGPGGDFSEAMTDSSGYYTLYVSGGTYGVEARPEFGSPWVSGGHPQDLTISDNQTKTGINFTMVYADVTINGIVVDTSGDQVSDFFGFANVMSDKQMMGPGPGEMYGGQIHNGQFQVKVPSSQLTDVIVSSFIEPRFPYSIREEVSLTISPNGTYNVQLVLVPNDAVVQGVVTDQDGNVISDYEFAEVFIMGKKGQWYGTHLEEGGNYRISLRSGTYEGMGAHVIGGSYMDQPPRFEEGGLVISAGTTTRDITVRKADAKINVTLKKPNGSLLDGHGFTFAHEEFDDQKVDFKDVIEGGGEVFDGRGSINIIGGKTYIVGAPPPAEFGDRSSNWMSPNEQAVSVPVNGSVSVTLQYEEADGTITGNVYYQDGTPLDFGFVGSWAENGQNSGTPIFGGTYELPVSRDTIWHVNADTFNGTDFYSSGDTVIHTPDEENFTITRDFYVEKSPFHFPQPKCDTWDSTQPKVFSISDGSSINFPSGSLATEGNVTVCVQGNEKIKPEKNKKPVKFGYSITAKDSNNQSITNFNSAVTVSFKADLEQMQELGLTPADLLPAYFNETTNKWETVNTYSVDRENDLVQFTTTHFTDFAIVTGASTASLVPVASDIVVTPAADGGPQVVVYGHDGTAKLNFFAYSSAMRVGIQAAVGDLNGDGTNEIIVAPGAGAGPQVRVFDMQGQPINQFFAFASHLRTGMNIAVVDVDGDGSDEVIATAMAGAGPQVRIFNAAGEVESQFWAYPATFRGGINLTTGDVDGDGTLEMIVAPASAGGPQIRVFDYDGSVVAQFLAYAGTVRGGYMLDTGDMNNDGTADIIVAPGEGLGPQVATFTYSGDLIKRFFAYADTFRGGIQATVGDVSGDTTPEIIVTALTNAGPHVRIFDTTGNAVSQYWAYAQTLRGGFSTMIADVDSDGTNEVVTGPGAGFGAHIRAFDYDGTIVSNFFGLHSGFRGGSNISSIPTLQ